MGLLLLVLEEPHGMLLKRGRMTSGVTKTVVLQVAKWRVVAALMKTGSLLAAHMMECMKYAGMKIQIHKDSRIGTMDVHCVPVSMLAPKRRSASRVRDGSTTQRIALTAAPSWRALLPTQTLQSASALQTRFPVWTVPSAKEPDTGTDPPSCLGGEWYPVEDWEGADEWCNKYCCADGCTVESGCCSYENGVSTGGSYDGVHQDCWDENPDPWAFPDWVHDCALCPGLDAGSQEKECLEGQGWIDDPKNCVDFNDVLKNSFPNAETGECECRINQIPNDDGTECIWDPNAPFDSSSKNGSDGNTDCTDPTGCSEEDPTEMPSATPDMPSLPGSDSASDVAAEETPSIGTPSLPGSDSALDAAAEETPSTTGTPPLPGSDTPTVDAKETPSTTGTPPLPGSDTPTADAN